MYGGRLWAGGRDFRGRVGTSDAIAKPLEALLYLKSHIVSHQNSDPTIQNPTPTVECFIRILGPYFRLIITQPHSPHIIPLIMTTPTPPPPLTQRPSLSTQSSVLPPHVHQPSKTSHLHLHFKGSNVNL